MKALPLNSAYKVPGGGLVGTAEAVARFGSLHVAPGYFSELVYAELFMPQKAKDGTETGVGFAWRVAKDDAGRTVYHHSGSQQGGRAHIAVYPEQNTAIALLVNMNYPLDIRALSDEVAEAFLPDATNSAAALRHRPIAIRGK